MAWEKSWKLKQVVSWLNVPSLLHTRKGRLHFIDNYYINDLLEYCHYLLENTFMFWWNSAPTH